MASPHGIRSNESQAGALGRAEGLLKRYFRHMASGFRQQEGPSPPEGRRYFRKETGRIRNLVDDRIGESKIDLAAEVIDLQRICSTLANIDSRSETRPGRPAPEGSEHPLLNIDTMDSPAFSDHPCNREREESHARPDLKNGVAVGDERPQDLIGILH